MGNQYRDSPLPRRRDLQPRPQTHLRRQDNRHRLQAGGRPRHRPQGMGERREADPHPVPRGDQADRPPQHHRPQHPPLRPTPHHQPRLSPRYCPRWEPHASPTRPLPHRHYSDAPPRKQLLLQRPWPFQMRQTHRCRDQDLPQLRYSDKIRRWRLFRHRRTRN